MVYTKASLVYILWDATGGATSAANNSVADRLFKTHGRWRSENAKDGYVQNDVRTKLSVCLNLGI